MTVFNAAVQADIIDDFTTSVEPPIKIAIDSEFPNNILYANSKYEFDQTIINDHRYIAISSSSRGVTSAGISGGKLRFSSTSDSGALLLYNQARGEPDDLDISHLFSSGPPILRIDLESEIEDSIRGDMLMMIMSRTGYIIIRKEIPGRTRHISHQISSADIPSGFNEAKVSSIRLFLSFRTPVSIAIERYSLITENPNAVPATGLKMRQDTPGMLRLSSSRSFIGYRYGLYRTSDPTLPASQWQLVESLPGSGGALEWSFPTSVFGPRQFFSLGVFPGP